MGMSLIEGDGLAQALYWLAVTHTDGWTGSASELLAGLRQMCADHALPAADLPLDPRVVGRRVREIAPSLRKAGIDVRPLPRSGARRGYQLRKIDTTVSEQPNTPPSSSSFEKTAS
jgi:hypothetical protein